ncbi:MAG: hypothetical protein IKB23_02575, partial [Clostridia bacterium]|nr:hypothetical protein [Clostridia bacterium]
DSCSVAFNSSDSASFAFEGIEELSEAELEYLHYAMSLTDGAVSFSDIKVDFCGISSNEITISYNGGEEIPVENGSVYKDAGEYFFKLKTVFGTVETRTLYIMDMGEDLAFGKFFGAGLCDSSLRMYDERFTVPCFMTGMTISFAEMPNTPGIYGTISYSKDGETSTVIDTLNGVNEGYSKTLTDEGVYVADLYSSNPKVDTGSIAHYVFAFAISEDSSYAPKINYSLISGAHRNILFSTKLISVALKSAGGGNYLYCFPATEEYRHVAYELSEDIEMLSIESYTDSDGNPYWYYKSKTNANVKAKYEGDLGKRAMFETLGYYAHMNVNDIYVEANSEYGVQPVEDSEALKRLTETSITNDVKVVMSESIKLDMLTPELYLNGFTFKHLADYESAWIVATDLKTGEAYFIDYDTDLSNIFDESAHVRIKEGNFNGTTVYDTVWYAPDENHGIITFSIDGVPCEISEALAGEALIAEKVIITKAIDEYDSNSILVLKNLKTSERKTLLLTEASELVVPAGEWELEVINRFSNTYGVTITVTEPEPVEAPEASNASITDKTLEETTETPKEEAAEAKEESVTETPETNTASVEKSGETAKANTQTSTNKTSDNDNKKTSSSAFSTSSLNTGNRNNDKDSENGNSGVAVAIII